jgi:proliferating cell nuclear antigen
MPFSLLWSRKVVCFAQNLQAMDNSHVALVAVKLNADGFAFYRCDRPIPLGVNLASLFKVLKCAKDDDKCTLKADDDADVLHLKYEAKRMSPSRPPDKSLPN